MCTGGLASAVHVKCTVVPVHTLLVVLVAKRTFVGGSIRDI